MKVTKNIEEFINDLNNGKVVCFKTDTIWGLSANPYDKRAIEELYKIKNRDINKPFIFLIKKDDDIEKYTTKLTIEEKNIIKKIWPGPVSIIFNYNKNSKLLQFYNTQKTIAIRNPKNILCEKILSNIAYPLPSTSVNIEGMEPFNNFKEIKNFLKDKDVTVFYSKTKNKEAISSTLIKFENKQIVIIRKGNMNKKILDCLKI